MASVMPELLPLNEFKINKLSCNYVISEQNFIKCIVNLYDCYTDLHIKFW